ncbi:UNVERIFIED_CONTAM: hypothetical protein NCL1_28905 [Trichonephila clavipes]
MLKNILPKAQPLIAFLNDEIKLEMNTNQNVSSTNSGTAIDAVFQRFLNTLKSQDISYYCFVVASSPADLIPYVIK